MYKSLIEDSTEEKANTAIEQWRAESKADFSVSYDAMEKISKHVINSQHVRELVAASVLQSTLQRDDSITAAILNVTTGILLGFKYAMYLQEQRELQELETK